MSSSILDDKSTRRESPPISRVSRPDFDSLTDSLHEMFGMFPKKEVRSAVEEADGVETRAIDILLNLAQLTQESSTSTKVSREVGQLKDLFPDIDINIIEQSFKDNGDDIDRTTESLLNHSILEELKLSESEPIQKDKSEIKPQKKPTKKIQRKVLVTSEPPPKPKMWGAINEEVKKVVDFTGCDSKTCRSAYHGNNSSVIRAIIHLIKWPPSPSVLNDVEGELKMPVGGRVQYGGGGPIVGKKPTQNKPNEPDHTPYVYDENSNEAGDLKSLYNSSNEFLRVDELFLEKALAFFEGDLDKVFMLVSMIVHENAYEFTYEEGRYMRSSSELLLERQKELEANTVQIINPNRMVETTQSTGTGFTTVTKSTNYYLNKSNEFSQKAIASSKLVASYYNTLAAENRQMFRDSAEQDQRGLMKQKLNQARSSHKLDLHNLSTSLAVETAQRGLEEWWGDEIAARVKDGNVKDGGFKAKHLEPLAIVTGRGIHSHQGVSRNKISVRNYLIENQYLFEEASSRFIVSGRRKLG